MVAENIGTTKMLEPSVNSQVVAMRNSPDTNALKVCLLHAFDNVQMIDLLSRESLVLRNCLPFH